MFVFPTLIVMDQSEPAGGPTATHGIFSGTFTAADLNPEIHISFASAVSAIEHGNTYVDIHTSKFLDGEIRGLLAEIPEPGTFSLLAVAVIIAAYGVRGSRAA